MQAATENSLELLHEVFFVHNTSLFQICVELCLGLDAVDVCSFPSKFPLPKNSTA